MSRRIRNLSTPLIVASVLAGITAPAHSETPVGTTRIEEDWELVVREPSVIEYGPQISTIMAPEPNPARTLMIFNLNFREEPFRPGGLQVDCWYDETMISHRESDKWWPLYQNNETVRWTQRLTVQDNVLTFHVLNGSSTSWGAFGEGATLKLSVTTHVNSLVTYESAFSVDNSRVGWQANRVQHLRLLQVRYYNGDTLISVEDAPRDVDLKWSDS